MDKLFSDSGYFSEMYIYRVAAYSFLTKETFKNSVSFHGEVNPH